METLSFWQYILQWIEGGFAIPLWILGIVELFAVFVPRYITRFIPYKPKKDYPIMNKVIRYLKIWAPIILALIMVVDLVWTPFKIYQENQRQINDVFVNQQSQISDLNQQITDLKASIPLGLHITSLPIESPRVESGNTAEVTITVTPRFIPPYSSTLKKKIENPDPRYYLYEAIRFSTSSGFKFMPFEEDLPQYFEVQSGYEYKDTMVILVKDYPPLASNIIPFRVYSLDVGLKGTEQVNIEILTIGVDKSIIP